MIRSSTFFRLVFILVFLSSCDFTSGMRKDILKAQELVTKQEFKAAAEVYESLLARNQGQQVALKIHFQLGEIYSVYLGEYRKADKHYQKLTEISDAPLWQIQGLEKRAALAFDYQKNYALAEKFYKTLKSFKPSLEKKQFYEYRHALALFHQQKLDESFQLIKEMAARPHQFQVKALYHLGLIRYLQKQWDESIFYWAQYLKKETDQNAIVQTKFLMGNAYETEEKLEEAYNMYYSIIGDYPRPQVIQQRLQSLYSRRIDRKR